MVGRRSRSGDLRRSGVRSRVVLLRSRRVGRTAAGAWTLSTRGSSGLRGLTIACDTLADMLGSYERHVEYHSLMGLAGSHQSAVVVQGLGSALADPEDHPVGVACHGPVAVPVEEVPVPDHLAQHYLPLFRQRGC
jgi:hypothetical protein